MRFLVLPLVTGLVLAAPAAAVLRTPQMTLRPADVPRGFVLDRSRSGAPTFSSPSEVPTGFRAGSFTSFRDPSPQPTRRIESLAFVFSGADTAERFLVTLRRVNSRLRSEAVSIGSRGVILTPPGPDSTVIVAWRHGRITALVVCRKVDRPRERAIALARVQERRIVAALR